ncbi:MAG: HD domain-containing protein [Candidatus Marsarchaeota archaeon]|nr:HD domain-containing protein [Candidatus Marsarchaeota archaeon]
MPKTREIRDPIHGFIVLNDWEREIVDHWLFQRLRRIRQLGWTDMVYPGASHTRFEHSLGVMHNATRMYKRIVNARSEFLESVFSYNKSGLDRDKVLVRIAALLHDVGHAPFSHAAEELMLENPNTGRRYKHEDYSSAAIVRFMGDVIENHPWNTRNYGITAKEVADFLAGDSRHARRLFWRELISSQLDADRADYLLRDSHHIGVAYGHFDLDRVIHTLSVAVDPETEAPKIGVESGGKHAAEGLILARYMMFTQVYFQHTRRAYDHHLAQALRELLLTEQKDKPEIERACFPPPTTEESLRNYLDWTDRKVLGQLSGGAGGKHARILECRDHYRDVHQTPEVPSPEDIDEAQAAYQLLAEYEPFYDKAESSWYKFEKDDISVIDETPSAPLQTVPLSSLSSVVSGLKAIKQIRIYVPRDKKRDALAALGKLNSKQCGEGRDTK